MTGPQSPAPVPPLPHYFAPTFPLSCNKALLSKTSTRRNRRNPRVFTVDEWWQPQPFCLEETEEFDHLITTDVFLYSTSFEGTSPVLAYPLDPSPYSDA